MSDRRFGIPRTEAEREQNHYQQYGTNMVPPRGSGIRGIGEVGSSFFRMNNPLAWLIGVASAYMIATSTGMINSTKKTKTSKKKNPRMPGELPGQLTWDGLEQVSNPLMNGLMISSGNSKVGNMWTWSITAGPPMAPWYGSCPGATIWCRDSCYAQHGRFVFTSSKAIYRRNFHMSKQPNFVEQMNKTLRELPTGQAMHMQKSVMEYGYPMSIPRKSTPKRMGTIAKSFGMGAGYDRVAWTKSGKNKSLKVLRLHVSGDLYSEKYINDWIKIAQANPDWKFYTYTRSWRNQNGGPSSLVPALKRLGSLPNFKLMISTDPCTGNYQKIVPELAMLEEGAVEYAWSNRETKPCPNLIDGTNCDHCALCWSKNKHVNVVFPVHSLSQDQMDNHRKITAQCTPKFPDSPWRK